MNAGEEPGLVSSPRTPLAPWSTWGPGFGPRRWERQGQGRLICPPPVTLCVPFQALGMAATGTEATRRQQATVSVCFSLSEVGEKLQLSSHA